MLLLLLLLLLLEPCWAFASAESRRLRNVLSEDAALLELLLML